MCPVAQAGGVLGFQTLPPSLSPHSISTTFSHICIASLLDLDFSLFAVSPPPRRPHSGTLATPLACAVIAAVPVFPMG